MSVPDWITKDFIQSCLQSQEEGPITVENHTVGVASIPDGSNYGSQIFRVKVDYNKGGKMISTSLIMKVPLAELEEDFSVMYKIEPTFYSKFINATYKYSKHDMVPKYYNSPEPQCVVLEDLSTSGYVMVDRHNFLDLEHCQLYIKSSAKLHALSIAIHKNNPEIIQSLVSYSKTLADSQNKVNKIMMEGGLRCMAAYLEDKPDYKEYLNILKEGIKNDMFWKIYQEMENKLSEAPLKALTKIDPWCTNMMFKYNSSGLVESIKMLDFQGLAFTTPIKELVAFISVSPNIEVRLTKVNDILHLYCDTLNGNLAELGCPERLSYEDMKEQMATMSPLIIFLICSCVPIGLAEGSADLNEYLTGRILNVPIKESSIYKLYQSISFNKYFPKILEITAKDAFDFLKEKMMKMSK